MQKVESSSLFSRLHGSPANRGASVVLGDMLILRLVFNALAREKLATHGITIRVPGSIYAIGPTTQRES